MLKTKEVNTAGKNLVAKQPLASIGSSLRTMVTGGAQFEIAARDDAAFRPAIAENRRLWIVSFILIVLLPFACAVSYMALYASPRYTAEFRAIVRSAESSRLQGFPMLLGLGGGAQSANDSYAVAQYLKSRELLTDMGQSLDIRKHYTDTKFDYLSRLAQDAQVERLVRYWQSMSDANYESNTGTIVFRVTAFDPKTALEIAKRALSLAEILVNRMSMRAREDTVRFSEDEVTKAAQRLADVRDQVRALREAEGTLDARKSAEAAGSVVAKLRDEIANARALLAMQRTYLSADSPTVVISQRRIAALETEVANLTNQMSHPQTGTAPSQASDAQRPLTQVMTLFERLESERQFAENAYQASLISLQNARTEANRQTIYLAVVVNPQLPEEISFPRLFYHSTLVLLVLLIVWIICSSTILAIREYR